MARSLLAGFLTALAGDTVYPVLFILGEFDSGDLQLWSGVGDKDWDSRTWTGAGHVLDVSAVKEDRSRRFKEMTFTLSGLDAANISLVENEDYQDRPAHVWFGLLDADGAVVADPTEVFQGEVDVIRDRDEGETATIVCTVSIEDTAQERARNTRYTDQDQRRIDATDTFFAYVTEIQDLEIIGKPG